MSPLTKASRAALVAMALGLGAAGAAAQHGEDPHGDEAGAEGLGHDAAEELTTDTHDAHGHGPVTVQDVLSSTAFWATVINFVIFVFLLTRLARRPVSEFLTTRRQGIETGLEEGKRLKAEAEATKAKYEARMAELDQELEALRTEIVRSGTKERDRLKAEAEERAARMRKDAELAIEQRVRQLRHDLKQDTVQAAVDAAKGLLREHMTADDQQRLADGYLEGLRERVKAAVDQGAAS